MSLRSRVARRRKSRLAQLMIVLKPRVNISNLLSKLPRRSVLAEDTACIQAALDDIDTASATVKSFKSSAGLNSMYELSWELDVCTTEWLNSMSCMPQERKGSAKMLRKRRPRPRLLKNQRMRSMMESLGRTMESGVRIATMSMRCEPAECYNLRLRWILGLGETRSGLNLNYFRLSHHNQFRSTSRKTTDAISAFVMPLACGVRA